MNKVFFLLLTFISYSCFIKAQFTNTTPALIQQHFQENWNAEEYPRMYGSNGDIQRLRELYQNKDILVSKSVERILKEADQALSKSIPGWGLDEANLRVSSVHTLAKEFIPQLTCAYLVTRDQKYATRAWDVAMKLMTYQDWGVATAAPFRDRHFLDTGIGAFNVAMLYDGLSDWLTKEQKDQLYQMAFKYVFNPVYAQYTGSADKTWNWMYASNNWNGICNGGVITACLTMMEHNPALLSDIASRAINCLPNYIKAFEPDGQSEEGLMYWSYGLMYTTTALDIMERTLGTTYGYADTNGMKKTGYFPVFTSGPVVSLNIGDDPIKNSRANTLFWLAKYHKDNSLARLQYNLLMENGGTMPWYDLFHYFPDMVQAGEALEVKPDNYTRGIDVYTFVENWVDPNSLFLSVHGGDNRANHAHLDAGSFDIQAFGEVFAYGNLGSDNYTYPGYFDFADKQSNDCAPFYKGTNYEPASSQSWHFYRKRAEGKNCVVFNPDYRADQNPANEAVEKNFFNSSDSVGCGAINLNMIYDRDVRSYSRGFKLDRKRKVITIQDLISAREPKDIWWSMHTKASISLSEDGRQAVLEQNGKKLKAILRSPHDAVFQTGSATYLKGRTFPKTKNSVNTGFKKLLVSLPQTKDATIRVEFMAEEIKEYKEIFDDFEGFSYLYEPVNLSKLETNVANPLTKGINTSSLVFKHTKRPGAAEYAGIKTSGKPIQIGYGKGMFRFLKVKLLKSNPGDVRLKLEQGENNEIAEFAPIHSPGVTGEWQEYVFDLFYDHAGVSQQGKTYKLFFLMPDRSDMAETETYIDDIILTNVLNESQDNAEYAIHQVENVLFSDRTDNGCRIAWSPVADTEQYQVMDGNMLIGETTNAFFDVSANDSGNILNVNVIGVNAKGQVCLPSEIKQIPLRKKTDDYEVIDDFENSLGWDAPMSSSNVYPGQKNPQQNKLNPSEICSKFNRLPSSTADNYMELAGVDLYDFSKIRMRYLHIKMYRSVKSGMQVHFRDGNKEDFILAAPINADDTLKTGQWVDYVFDLNALSDNAIFRTLRIYPDMTSYWSSSKNYFLDDVVFSHSNKPFEEGYVTGVDAILQPDNFSIYYHEGCVRIKGMPFAKKVSVYTLSGMSVLSGFPLSGDLDEIVLTLQRGVYIVNVISEEKYFSQKLIVNE